MGVLAPLALGGITASTEAAPARAQAVTASATGSPRAVASDRFMANPPATHGVERVLNYAVSMRDGARLVGNVYYPTALETGLRVRRKLPVLVTMTPYAAWDGSSDGKADDLIAKFFAARGYVCLVMDTRGTGRSGGVYAFESPAELLDYREVIEHAAEQLPGSNGVVGLSGMSYRGINQLLVGGLLDPSGPVRAMAPASAGNVSRGIFINGGIPTLFAHAYAGIETLAELPPADQLDPQRGVDLLHLGQVLNDRIPTMLYHAKWESDLGVGGEIAYADWWASREPMGSARRIARARIPVLLTSGPRDFFVRNSLRLYTALQNAAAGRPVWGPMPRTAKPSPRYQLVWGTSYTDGAHAHFLAYELQWYDHWLKGIRNGVGRPSRTLHVQEFGGRGRWVDIPHSAFPMTRSYTRYFLGSSATLRRTPEAKVGVDSMEWSPDATVEYTTAPLVKGATLAGPVAASLQISTSGRDAQLVATLQDVAPDGTVTTVVPALEVDGALMASHRAIDRQRSWYDDEGRLIYPHHPFTQAAERPLTPPGGGASRHRDDPALVERPAGASAAPPAEEPGRRTGPNRSPGHTDRRCLRTGLARQGEGFLPQPAIDGTGCVSAGSESLTRRLGRNSLGTLVGVA